MKRTWKKSTTKKDITKSSHNRYEGLLFPPFNRETRIERIQEEKENRRAVAEKKIKEKYKNSDWVLVEDDEVIVKIWGVLGDTLLDKKRRGDVFFYLWKYSGLAILIEEETDFYPTKEEIDLVLREVSYKKYFWNNRIINNFGVEELTHKGSKTEKTDKGAEKYSILEGDPLRRGWVNKIPLDIENIPESVIKYIINGEKEKREQREQKNKKKK